MYVETLIGSKTINTIPLETLNAYREHGKPASQLEEGTQEANHVLEGLHQAGIDLDALTQELEDEGVTKFSQAFDQLMAALREKRAVSFQEPVDRETFVLGNDHKPVQARVADLDSAHFSTLVWRKDPSLWKSDPKDQAEIRNALGWLHVAEKMEGNMRELTAFKNEILNAGFRHVLHMGGSSLTPLVFERIFTPAVDALPLTVLDSTDPATILKIEKALPI